MTRIRHILHVHDRSMVIHQPVRICRAFFRFGGVTLAHGSGVLQLLEGRVWCASPLCGAASQEWAVKKCAAGAECAGGRRRVRRRRRKSVPAPAQKCAGAGAEVRRFLRRSGALCAPPHHIGVGTPHSGCPFLTSLPGEVKQHARLLRPGLAFVSQRRRRAVRHGQVNPVCGRPARQSREPRLCRFCTANFRSPNETFNRPGSRSIRLTPSTDSQR